METDITEIWGTTRRALVFAGAVVLAGIGITASALATNDARLAFSGTIAATTLGAMIVIWQVNKTASQAIAAQRDQSSQQSRLEIYRSIVEARTEAYKALSRLQSLHIALLSDMTIRRSAGGAYAAIPTVTSERLVSTFSDASSSITRVISIVESWQVFLPGFDVFQSALAFARQRVQATWEAFFQLASREAAQALAAAAGRDMPTPDDHAMQAIEQTGQNLQEACFDVGAYLHDLGIEAQNVLLADIATSRAPARRSANPSIYLVVTSIEPIASTQRIHFNSRLHDQRFVAND